MIKKMGPISQIMGMVPGMSQIQKMAGPLDEKALVKALQEKKIFAAGLDVFEQEPALAPGLIELPNVVIPPHIASATFGTRTRMAEMAAKNLIDALEGRMPEYCVNSDQLKYDKK
jgi:lactate dehydrogenase-like 2-hydroxyacid dehydrogenase